jgi:hypothetical protein
MNMPTISVTPPSPTHTQPLPPNTPQLPPSLNTMPSRIPLRRSPRLAAHAIPSLPTAPHNNLSLLAYHDDTPLTTFLTEFAPIRDTHFLLPVSLTLASASSVSEALAAMSNGETEILLEDDNDPSWSSALASPNQEYWIAGACEELKSLEDLKVFILVPCSDVPRGQ